MPFVKRHLLVLRVTSDQHGLRNYMETFDGYLPLTATGYRTLAKGLFRTEWLKINSAFFTLFS
jgi:hypothetical protein